MKAKILLIAILILKITSLYSQNRKIQNIPYADQKIIHFGFNIGMNMQDMPLTNTGFKQTDGEVWYASQPSYSVGFNVGLIADYYLSQYFNLRFSPIIFFGDRSFKFYEENSDEIFSKSMKANHLLFPLHLKINGTRTNNYRPYLLIGAYCSTPIGNKKNEIFRYNSLDYGIDFGVGISLYTKYFKLSPELRFSFGLKNIINTDRSDLLDNDLLKYSQTVNNGKNRIVSLIFNFE